MAKRCRPLLMTALAISMAMALLPPSAGAADLSERAATFARELVALRNERVAIGLKAESILRGNAAYDEAESVVRTTRYALVLAQVVENGAVNLSMARRDLPGGPKSVTEHLAFDEATDPFLIDAVQFLQPELAGALLRSSDLPVSAQDQIIFDYLLSTLGTGGSYTVSVGTPPVAAIIANDPALADALSRLQVIAKALFEARADAPLGLKALAERIPVHWQPFVGAQSASERDGGSGLNRLGQLERDSLLIHLAQIERDLDGWTPASCPAKSKSEIQLALLSLIRTLQVAVPSLERLHNQLLALDETVPSLVLLERFNTVDTLQVSLDSQWLEAGDTLSETLMTSCQSE